MAAFWTLLMTSCGVVLGFSVPVLVFHSIKENVIDTPSSGLRLKRNVPDFGEIHMEFIGSEFLSRDYFAALDGMILSESLDSEHVEDEDSKISIVVLSSNDTKKEDGVRWEKYLLPGSVIQILQTNSKLKGVKQYCTTTPAALPWHILVDDLTFPNTFMLRHFLERLPEEHPVSICDESTKHEERATIVNTLALEQLCTAVEYCTSEECLGRFMDKTCFNITTVYPEAVFTLSNDVDNLMGSAFIKLDPPAFGPIEVYQQILQERAVWLSQSLSVVAPSRGSVTSSQRLKRESDNEARVSDWGFPLPDVLQNETSLPDPFYYLINKENYYDDSCLVVSKDTQTLAPSYNQALNFAQKSFEENENKLPDFSYNIIKPNYGQEHHLYFVDANISSDGFQHSRQVITLEEYSRPTVAAKTIRDLKQTILCVSTSSSSELISFLEMARDAILEVASRGQEVKVAVFVKDRNFTEMAQAADVVQSFSDINITFLSSYGTASLGSKLQYLISQTTIATDVSNDLVVLHVPDHAVFNWKLILRCSLNAQQGETMYFPIPFQRSEQRLVKPHTQNLWWGVQQGKGGWSPDSKDVFCADSEDLRVFADSHVYSGGDLYQTVIDSREVEPLRFTDSDLHLLKQDTQDR